MGKRIDILGKVFGALTVVSYAETRVLASGQKVSRWNARCVCGTVKSYTSLTLRSGLTTSCGCRRYINHSKPDEHVYITSLMNRYESNARKKGREFSLSREQIYEITTKACHYCRKPPAQVSSSRFSKFVYNSIDRVDNNKGYTLDNIVPCCDFCNRAKSDFPIEEFTAWLAWVRQPQDSPPKE